MLWLSDGALFSPSSNCFFLPPLLARDARFNATEYQRLAKTAIA
ncbi:hypothetical protein [Stenomitos frigidus]|nr:hypothetical protein [Stenomitos frigidus]